MTAALLLLVLTSWRLQAQPLAASNQPTTESASSKIAAPDAAISGKEPQVEFDVPTSRDAITILPPLSIQECVAVLKLIEARLVNPEIGMDRWNPKETARVFELLLDYIQLTDRKHSSLGNYTWNYLGENGVALGVTDRDSYYVAPVLSNVSAISFTASGGNVLVETIEVIDISNTRYGIPVNRRVIADLPRREVSYLNLPVTVKEVVVYYSVVEGKPRVQLYGGISRKPEYLKAAQHYLLMAQNAITEKQRDSARAAILEAEKQLMNFLNR